jgi:hypothetical protein
MEASPGTERLAPAKRKLGRQGKIIVSCIVIALIASSVVTAVYLVQSSVGVGCGCATIISMNKSSDAEHWTFTIAGVSPPQVLKNDVRVQLTNASGWFVINNESLTVASGTHGFSYIPASSVDQMSVGDVFILNKTTFGAGSTLRIISGDGTTTYADYTV